MKTLQLFDPPLCCSTGVCGPEIDPLLPQTAAFLDQLSRLGVEVKRANLGQQPLEFVSNTKVKQLLDAEGVDVLPLILIDGEVVLKGRYPTEPERDEWLTKAGAPVHLS